MTKDEMVGWHHQLDGHEFEQTPRDSGQGSLACCSVWGRKELDMTECPWRRTRGSLRSSSCLGRKPPRAPQLEETPEMPPSSRGEGLLFLPGLESNHESSLKSEEEAGLP